MGTTRLDESQVKHVQTTLTFTEYKKLKMLCVGMNATMQDTVRYIILTFLKQEFGEKTIE